MNKKPTVLMILDGYGLNEKKEGNAVLEGRTPVMDGLMAECPFVRGNASGMAVGLPDGQMGNSEVGHLNMGAGRIVYQDLTKITKAIQDGDFFENPALLAACENVKKNNSALHMYGLVSDGVCTLFLRRTRYASGLWEGICRAACCQDGGNRRRRSGYCYGTLLCYGPR